ncbi:TonB-dependent siderophore receptor [Pseudomonas donghuensis]|uniref:TonB-dependent siderophore receptor n=1 Tax=Pseudomonas donghuensis TaxID=1163398 RepID=UPI002852ECCA|nr:TonB-dependent siderophore receptor [Pseudomonas donghuensis]
MLPPLPQHLPFTPTLLAIALCAASAGLHAATPEDDTEPVDVHHHHVWELGETRVISNQLGTITEGNGSYTPGTIATATRLVLTPKQTPQSISVVTRQFMDDFNLNAIDEVMRHTPGITVSRLDSERTTYYSRGYSIQNYQYDGIPTLDNGVNAAGNNLSDTAIYDRIEVIKGANGLLSGAGKPGAAINFVRKKPTADFNAHIGASGGSWDNYRSELDVSGALNDSASVRARAVAAFQDKHSFQDHYERKTSVYYGIVEMDLDDDTLLTLGADYQDNDPRGSSWAAIPIFNSDGNLNKVSRSFNPGAQWSRWEQYTRTAFASLERHFASDWVAKFELSHKLNGYHARLGSLSGGAPNPRTGSGSALYSGKFTGETKTDTAELYATGPFELFGREHELVVGTSYSRARFDAKAYDAAAGYNNRVDNFYTWNGNIAEPDWKLSRTDDLTTRQTASYITARFKPTDDLALILGSRFANFTRSGDSDQKESGRAVPYAGVVYDLNPTYAVYASYTSIFNPQSSQDRFGKTLEPNEGDNYEVGLKGEWFDGRLNASLAYFEIHEDNRAEQDRSGQPSQVLSPYVATKAKSKGYEAEISGELARGWQVQAGYTHKVIRDDDGDKISTWEPEDQVSLFTSYKLPGELERMTVGGGARWQGKSWQAVNNPVRGREDYTQEAYWLVDLMTRYQFTDRLCGQVNLNNLFDKKYFTNVGFYNSYYYGDPRNLSVSARYDF